MSKLDSFINRMQAQRACIELARTLIAELPGVVFELGLGGGRTYDHLRERLPGRRILVFERKVYAPVELRPDPDDLVFGEIPDTLPAAAELFREQVALVHSDIGIGDQRPEPPIQDVLCAHLPKALKPGAVIISDLALEIPETEPLPLPEGVSSGRYYMRRRRPTP